MECNIGLIKQLINSFQLQVLLNMIICIKIFILILISIFKLKLITVIVTEYSLLKYLDKLLEKVKYYDC